MSDLVTPEILEAAFKLFDELTLGMEVVRGEMTGMDNPFDHHFYCSFIISDEEVCKSPDMLSVYLAPLMTEMANNLRHVKKFAVRPLASPRKSWGAVTYNFPNARIPFRCTLCYDIVKQGTVVTIDVLGRHVGNYYKTIINGPLHRHQMPFMKDPKDDHEFDYLYVPHERKAYGNWVYESEDDEEGEYVRLPGLETCVEDTSLHHYRVRGDYCYYVGEILERELKQ